MAAAKKTAAKKTTAKRVAKKAPAKKASAKKTASSSPRRDRSFGGRATELAEQALKVAEDTRGKIGNLRETFADVMDAVPGADQEVLAAAARRTAQTFADVERALDMLQTTATDLDRAGQA